MHFAPRHGNPPTRLFAHYKGDLEPAVRRPGMLPCPSLAARCHDPTTVILVICGERRATMAICVSSAAPQASDEINRERQPPRRAFPSGEKLEYKMMLLAPLVDSDLFGRDKFVATFAANFCRVHASLDQRTVVLPATKGRGVDDASQCAQPGGSFALNGLRWLARSLARRLGSVGRGAKSRESVDGATAKSASLTL